MSRIRARGKYAPTQFEVCGTHLPGARVIKQHKLTLQQVPQQQLCSLGRRQTMLKHNRSLIESPCAVLFISRSSGEN